MHLKHAVHKIETPYPKKKNKIMKNDTMTIILLLSYYKSQIYYIFTWITPWRPNDWTGCVQIPHHVITGMIVLRTLDKNKNTFIFDQNKVNILF